MQDSVGDKKKYELLYASTWRDLFEEIKNANDYLIVDQLNQYMSDKVCWNFDEQKRPRIHTIEDFTYVFIAPFVMGFMQWLLQKVRTGHYDKILFSTRDGYLIQQLYQKMIRQYGLKNMPEDIYFPISRTLCVAAAVFSEEDIVNYARVKYAPGPEEMLARRFGLRREEILPYDEKTYADVTEYALAHKSRIFASSARIRENYISHMRKLGLRKGEKYALFDFVSSGTCQLLLNAICDLDICGLYACRYFPFQGITNYTDVEAKCRLPIEAYVVNESTTEKESYFFKNYNFLEILFTSCEPSVASMDENGPVLDRERRTAEHLENVRRAQKAILDYVDEMSGRLALEEEISFALVDKILSLKDAAYTREECEFLDHCELVEDFGQGMIKIKRS